MKISSAAISRILFGAQRLKYKSSFLLLLYGAVFIAYRLISQKLYMSTTPNTMKFSDKALQLVYLNHFDRNICEGINTLVVIPSAPDSFKRRDYVRKTWMSTKVSV